MNFIYKLFFTEENIVPPETVLGLNALSAEHASQEENRKWQRSNLSPRSQTCEAGYLSIFGWLHLKAQSDKEKPAEDSPW